MSSRFRAACARGAAAEAAAPLQPASTLASGTSPSTIARAPASSTPARASTADAASRLLQCDAARRAGRPPCTPPKRRCKVLLPPPPDGVVCARGPSPGAGDVRGAVGGTPPTRRFAQPRRLASADVLVMGRSTMSVAVAELTSGHGRAQWLVARTPAALPHQFAGPRVPCSAPAAPGPRSASWRQIALADSENGIGARRRRRAPKQPRGRPTTAASDGGGRRVRRGKKRGARRRDRAVSRRLLPAAASAARGRFAPFRRDAEPEWLTRRPPERVPAVGRRLIGRRGGSDVSGAGGQRSGGGSLQ